MGAACRPEAADPHILTRESLASRRSSTGTNESLNESSGLNGCVQYVVVQTNPLSARAPYLNIGAAG